MYIEINISLNGNHFFATHKRSVKNYSKLAKVFKTLNQKFPEYEGYEITTTFYSDTGYIRNRSHVLEAIETNDKLDLTKLFRKGKI